MRRREEKSQRHPAIGRSHGGAGSVQADTSSDQVRRQLLGRPAGQECVDDAIGQQHVQPGRVLKHAAIDDQALDGNSPALPARVDHHERRDRRRGRQFRPAQATDPCRLDRRPEAAWIGDTLDLDPVPDGEGAKQVGGEQLHAARIVLQVQVPLDRPHIGHHAAQPDGQLARRLFGRETLDRPDAGQRRRGGGPYRVACQEANGQEATPGTCGDLEIPVRNRQHEACS